MKRTTKIGLLLAVALLSAVVLMAWQNQTHLTYASSPVPTRSPWPGPKVPHLEPPEPRSLEIRETVEKPSQKPPQRQESATEPVAEPVVVVELDYSERDAAMERVLRAMAYTIGALTVLDAVVLAVIFGG